MIFQVDRVFELFDEQGYIYSLRKEPKEVGEKVWIRRSRTGEKEFDVPIENKEKEIVFGADFTDGED